MSSSYNLKCPVARTLDIIGERWTILILRDLFLHGPRKFQDFEQSLSGISPTTLSARLKNSRSKEWSRGGSTPITRPALNTS